MIVKKKKSLHSPSTKTIMKTTDARESQLHETTQLGNNPNSVSHDQVLQGDTGKDEGPLGRHISLLHLRPRTASQQVLQTYVQWREEVMKHLSKFSSCGYIRLHLRTIDKQLHNAFHFDFMFSLYKSSYLFALE